MKPPLRIAALSLPVLLAFLSLASPRLGAQPRLPWTSGDCNRDGEVDISDAISTLQYLFRGEIGINGPPCEVLCDVARDGELDIADPIVLLNHLFRGGGPLLPPPLVPVDGCDDIDNDCDGVVDEACTAEVRLDWDPVTRDVEGNPESDIEYRVHYGIRSGRYTQSRPVGAETSVTISGLQHGVRYYFAVTALDPAGNESRFSNEVSTVAGEP